MDKNEINLEELMQINGGQNLAVAQISKQALRHNCFLASGNIDLASLQECLNKEELKELVEIRNQLLAQQDLTQNLSLSEVNVKHQMSGIF